MTIRTAGWGAVTAQVGGGRARIRFIGLRDGHKIRIAGAAVDLAGQLTVSISHQVTACFAEVSPKRRGDMFRAPISITWGLVHVGKSGQ